MLFLTGFEKNMKISVNLRMGLSLTALERKYSAFESLEEALPFEEH